MKQVTGRIGGPGISVLLRPALWLLLLLVFSGQTRAEANPDGKDLSEQYLKARAYYQELSALDTGTDRNSLLAAAAAFRNIYEAAPEHQTAPKALYMLGRVFQSMFQQSGKAQDLEQAIASYKELSSRYPKNFLADDAFFILGGIYLVEKKDPVRAAMAYTKIIALYPQGDMIGPAEKQLVQIKQGASAKPVSALEPQAQEVAGEKCISPIVAEKPQPQKISSKKTGAPMVLPFRHWSSKRYTRLVVETTEPVTFKHQMLSEDNVSPRRIYIDLHNSRLSPETVKTVPIEDGLLRRVRSAQFDPKTVRVVLDTQTNISDYKVFTLTNPFRVVIDVMSSDGGSEQGIKSVSKGKDGRIADKVQDPSSALPAGFGIKKIVIDPGHGGKDPGTCSSNGLKEKDIVLDVALRVAKALEEKPGYEVILTRDRDVFIPLEERTAMANAREADLFLSIHVNAAPNHEAKGIETYVLDLTSNKDTMRLAAMENATSAQQISDLQSILLDLMQNSKLNESLKLAGLVHEEMVSGLNKKFSAVSNLGVKKAPFVVLIGAQMPAILIEIAFLSNPEEEKRLKDAAYLAGVADHISHGVAKYIESMHLAHSFKR
jgi:N-acetylmuramoyl-L-alanine amidase